MKCESGIAYSARDAGFLLEKKLLADGKYVLFPGIIHIEPLKVVAIVFRVGWECGFSGLGCQCGKGCFGCGRAFQNLNSWRIATSNTKNI